MAFVYAGQDKDKTRFKLGKADELEQRKKTHRTSNPDFKYYKTYKTDRPEKAERFLKLHFADYLVSGTTEWFTVNSGDIDDAFLELDKYMILLPSTNQFRQLSLFSNQESSGNLLQADDAIRESCHRLRVIQNEIKRLKLQEALYTDNLKLYIGPNDGIEGFVSWATCSMGLHLDACLVKINHPEIYDACRVLRTARKFRLLNQPEEDEC